MESLGLESKTVRLVDYDECWPSLFAEEAREIIAAVQRHRLQPLTLEHVGSTSVPGLSAKPILDLAAGREPHADPAHYVPAFESVGYVYRGDGGLPGREFFRKGVLRTHHVHLVERGGAHWTRYLRFRDALRSDPQLRDAYATVKAALARQYPRDREAYIEGKTEFVTAVLKSGGRAH
jgi:GrpB-like predicted nucleotidyltransferase (UPF0157 family)